MPFGMISGMKYPGLTLFVLRNYAFGLFAQGYDMHYSHGTSNSGGIFIAIKHKVGVIVAKVTEAPG